MRTRRYRAACVQIDDGLRHRDEDLFILEEAAFFFLTAVEVYACGVEDVRQEERRYACVVRRDLGALILR